MNLASNDKLISSSQISALAEDLKGQGKKIVLCHGHFNVIHPGHLRFLQFAKTLGDVLVVSVCSQQELPNENKELFYSQEDRAQGVAGLDLTDIVVLVETHIVDVIKNIKPSVYVKGKEFEDRQFLIEDEMKQVMKFGGRTVFSSGDVKYSSTPFINDSNGKAQDRKMASFLNICFRNKIDLDKIDKTIDSFKDLNILVLGDTIVDQFVACDPLGVSSEAPVLVVKELEEKKFIGGAAIIAQHAKSLGANSYFVSVVGNDDVAEYVKDELTSFGVNHFLLKDSSRPTTFKIRYMASQQKLFRVSRLKQHLISKAQEDAILTHVDSLMPKLNGIILSDFVYGVVTDHLIERIKELASKYNVKIFADTQCSSQVGDVSRFQEIDLITPTEKEARISLADPSSGLEKLARNLMQQTKNKSIAITLGEQGLLMLFHRNNPTEEDPYITEFFPALEQNPVDVAGAGDAMLTGFALGMSSNLSVLESSVLASILSGISVMRIGNTPISPQEVKRYLVQLSNYKKRSLSHTLIDKRAEVTL